MGEVATSRPLCRVHLQKRRPSAELHPRKLRDSSIGIMQVTSHPGLPAETSPFNYDYVVNCACGSRTRLSAERYHEVTNSDARTPCKSCGRDIHCGPAVIALRDLNDPCLDNHTASRMAWFHTSTYSDWPSNSYTETIRRLLERGHAPVADIESSVRYQATKALHVGTYGCAIENMLRRMHDQPEPGATYYLHQVTVDFALHQINEGYSDENHVEASQISTTELDNRGLRALRYLNVRESPGSISLALVPAAVKPIATIELPPFELGEPVDALVVEASRLSRRESRLSKKESAKSESPLARLRRAAELRRPQLIASPSSSAEQMLDWRTLERGLVRRLLPNVNPSVADNFCAAMTQMIFLDKGSSDRDAATTWAAFASLLTKPEAVLDRLLREPPRPLPDAPNAAR